MKVLLKLLAIGTSIAFLEANLPACAAVDSGPQMKDEAGQIENACKVYRQENFLQGEVRLSVSRTGHQLRSSTERYRVWVDKGMHRVDRWPLKNEKNGDSMPDTIILDGGKYIQAPSDETIQVTVGKSSEYPDIAAFFHLIHPEFLGLGLHSDYLSNREGADPTYTESVGLSEFDTPVEIRSTRHQGRKATEITYFKAFSPRECAVLESAMQAGRIKTETKGLPTWADQIQRYNANVAGLPAGMHIATTRRLVFVPDIGSGLVSDMLATTTSSGTITFKLDVTYGKCGESSKWYPTNIIRSYSKGDSTIRQEKIDVDYADFDRPVPPEVFTLAGIELGEGRHIGDRSGSEIELDFTVKDGELEADPHTAVLTSGIDAGEGQSYSWTLIVNGIVCVVLGFALATRMIIARR